MKNKLLEWELDWIDANVERYDSKARANLVKANITARYEKLEAINNG